VDDVLDFTEEAFFLLGVDLPDDFLTVVADFPLLFFVGVDTFFVEVLVGTAFTFLTESNFFKCIEAGHCFLPSVPQPLNKGGVTIWKQIVKSNKN